MCYFLTGMILNNQGVLSLRNRTLSHQQLLFREARVSLSDKEREKLAREEAGYSGEVLFDSKVAGIVQNQNLIHIKNFMFEYDDDKECQIDNLVITSNLVYIFEIKNLNVDLVIDNNDTWKFENGQVMNKSPMGQALSQKFILQQLFKEINVPLSVESFVVFMNPAQMIYGLYPGNNVLLSFQLDKKLPYILKPNNYDFSEIRGIIESRRKLVTKYYKPFEFDVKTMKKGIVCDKCFNFIEKVSSRNLICRSCNKRVSMKEAMDMIISELNAYNPDLKMSSNDVNKLTGGIISSPTVRKYKQLLR